jgi:serine protease
MGKATDRGKRDFGGRGAARLATALGSAVLVTTMAGAAMPGPVLAATAGRATHVIEGYSDPTAGHRYRHGALAHGVLQTAPAAASAPLVSRVPGAAIGLPTRGQLYYRGGPVVSGQARVYLVFWGSQWGSRGSSGGYETFAGDPDGLAPALQAFFSGLGTNAETWSAVATQYCEGAAPGATTCPLTTTSHVGYPAPGTGVLAGVWEDTSFTPSSGPPGDPAISPTPGVSIAQEAAAAAVHFGDASTQAQYVIVSPTGTNPDGWLEPRTGFCAYHDDTQDAVWNGAVSGPDVAYTNLPYIPDAGPGYCSARSNPGLLDGATEAVSHEYAETLTDPIPGTGWTDARGNEIADKCAYLNLSLVGAPIYLQLSTGTFDVQGMWSDDANKGHGSCSNSRSPVVLGPLARHLSSTQGTPIVPVDVAAIDVIPGAVLSFGGAGLPQGISIDPVSGVMSGTPTLRGPNIVTLTVGDGTLSTVATFRWSVHR